ncbi:PREDICTED: probable cytochrome P450 303a1 [Habropoda laboriosa]|uniref:probable cytochrome P450 303a1 n=1 Tax=Habropoda laboriosa TaxID=597456 RepID=UPI00083D477A|nr:PREDICTED: probable cytochrome P450 303a1 [Habropoda laboriosa]
MFSTLMLLMVLLLLLLYLGSRKPKGYPPGPKWWPILGCAIEMARLRQETGYLFKTCSALCKKYGPVVGLKIGTDRIVVLNDYESIRSMLTNEDCDGRPIGPVYETRTFGSRRGLIVVDENLWIEQRRFVLKHLRDFGFGRKSMAMIIEEEAVWLVEHFKKLIGNSYDNRVNESSVRCNNNAHDDGQIYKLMRKDKTNESESTDKYRTSGKQLKASDMYVSANEYIEIKKLAQSNLGMVIPMDDAFGVTVLNTLWRMMAGKRFNLDDKELTYFQRILTKLLREIDMIGAPFGHFPILRFIAPEMSGYKSFLEIHQQLWKFLKEELDDHSDSFKSGSPRDLMDVYLTVLKSENYSSTFSESQLLAICVDLFMAGSETTSKALGFCFLYLVLFPSVQKKAHEEIDRVIGRNRPPTLEDRARMTYMNAIVLESLRMFMGRTLNVPHRALKDTTILGHKIPKDTMLIVNFNRILMDESWGDPEDFRPERFIDESGNIIAPNVYFPFSIGRHRCMGENLARSNIFIIATALLQAFTFSPVPGQKKPSSQDFVDGVTAGPKPFRVMVSLRT